MQVQTQNIQRPALFSDFFGLELMWNNEYLTYIHTFINRVTSALNDIKKSLNTNKSTQLKEFERECKRIAFNKEMDDINNDVKNIMSELVELSNMYRNKKTLSF